MVTQARQLSKRGATIIAVTVARSRGCGRAIAVAGAVVALAAATPALADHRPPIAALHVRHVADAQRGLLYSYEWVRPGGHGLCVAEAADGIRHWGHALRVGSGKHVARIVFANRTRPRSLAISGWRRLGSGGAPVGRPHHFDYELSPRRHAGRVKAWRARFSYRLRAGHHLYFDVFGRWRDRQGCGGTQDASWTFHVKA